MSPFLLHRFLPCEPPSSPSSAGTAPPTSSLPPAVSSGPSPAWFPQPTPRSLTTGPSGTFPPAKLSKKKLAHGLQPHFFHPEPPVSVWHQQPQLLANPGTHRRERRAVRPGSPFPAPTTQAPTLPSRASLPEALRLGIKQRGSLGSPPQPGAERGSTGTPAAGLPPPGGPPRGRAARPRPRRGQPPGAAAPSPRWLPRAPAPLRRLPARPPREVTAGPALPGGAGHGDAGWRRRNWCWWCWWWWQHGEGGHGVRGPGGQRGAVPC